MSLGYVSEKECKYHPKLGMHIPRVIYGVLEGRNPPPFVLYSFLMNDGEFPYVALFDEFGKKSEEFPLTEEPTTISIRSPKRIVLPAHFKSGLNLDDRVTVIGNCGAFELWNPADWSGYCKLHEKEFKRIMGEIFKEAI